jgi:hypothetical protein
MRRPNRRTVAELADVLGIGALVGAGWVWSSILGLALAGVGLLVIGAVVDNEHA